MVDAGNMLSRLNLLLVLNIAFAAGVCGAISLFSRSTIFLQSTFDDTLRVEFAKKLCNACTLYAGKATSLEAYIAAYSSRYLCYHFLIHNISYIR